MDATSKLSISDHIKMCLTPVFIFAKEDIRFKKHVNRIFFCLFSFLSLFFSFFFLFFFVFVNTSAAFQILDFQPYLRKTSILDNEVMIG